MMRRAGKRLVCRLVGHVPVWLGGAMCFCVSFPSMDYKCARCDRRIYWWTSYPNGFHLTPQVEREDT